MEQELSTLIAVSEPLIGVVIGVVGASIPLFLKLKHDSKEREKERQMSLRRDVYLPAMEKIGQELQYLMDLYKTNEHQPTGYYEAILQIQVIGSDETIAAVNKFNDHIVEAFGELMPQRQYIDMSQVRGKQEMKSINYEKDEEQRTYKYDIWNEFLHESIALTWELAEKCQQKVQLAEELLTPVIVAIRKEMGTPFDEETYRAMMKMSHENWKKGIEEYAKIMKAKYMEESQRILKEGNLKKDKNM